MNRILKFSGLTAVLALALVVGGSSVSAATISATAVFSGQTQVWGNPSATINVMPHVWANSGEVIHAIRTDFIGDNRESVCHDISNFTGAQDIDVSMSDTLPPNTGDYGFTMVLYTAVNMQQADTMSGSAACQGTSVTAYNQGNVVHVLPGGSGTPSSGDANQVGSTAWYQAQIAALQAQMSCQSTGGTWANSTCTPKPTPPVNTSCTEYASLSAGLYQGSDTRQGGSVGKLQSFLMYKGYDIPLLSANKAPYGFYGPQTAQAAMNFRNATGC